MLGLLLPASAALPPGAAEELKALAPEVLDVEVTAVETGRPEQGRFPVQYQARVLDVIRSAAGIAPGSTVDIDTFAVDSATALLGPKPPPLLSPGWHGRVWLKPLPTGAGETGPPRFVPAAYGHGFEALGGTR